MIRLYNAEALEWLSEEGREGYNMIFMDPPDNLGLKYGGLPDDWDKKSKEYYYGWLNHLILKSMFLAPIVWVSYYHRHDLEVKRSVAWILQKIKPTWEVRTFIWRFRFGRYRGKDCPNGYRPILRLSSPGVEWNVDAIKVESERMRLGDSRSAGPRVPDDVIEIECPYHEGMMGFECPRVVGNFEERRKWCPTQHPEGVLERIVKMSLPLGKVRILELFTGSGTMIRVVKKLLREIDLDTVELSENYVQRLKNEHPEIEVVKL